MNQFDEARAIAVAEARTEGLPERSARLSLAASDLAFGDIDLLFHAIQARLMLTASEGFAADLTARGQDPAARMREAVLDCVNELEQLHATMTFEVGRRRLLEQTVCDLNDVLADVQAELVGTRTSEREALRRASQDSLTLLPNAGVFRTHLHAAIAPSAVPLQAMAVLFLDLDGFKAVNDAHGHDTGDAVLRIVAVRLLGTVRSGDLVSRVGGDEFACLLTGVPDREHVGRLACKLFDAVASPLQIGGLRLSVRPSIGVAMYPDDGATPESLLHCADAAMYRAKRRNMGYSFFDAQDQHQNALPSGEPAA
jgi:diguanylate cyclase